MPPDFNGLPERAIALVIDDAPDTLGLVSEALEQAGMTVLVARSGQEGLELTRRVSPDVILMDAMMPGMDGFETCQRLKAPPYSDPTPVIFMTGLSDSEHILKGLQSGGVDYITKPVVVDELIARILTHVLNARAITAARSALDSAGQWVLAFSAQGRLSWGSAQALALLAAPEAQAVVFENQAALPLVRWLSELPGKPISAVGPFELAGYQFKYLGQSQNEVMVCVRATTQTDAAQTLSQTFALTERESEVLLWLTRGKTNRDIAEILTLSARTVNKHLEQVFHKMGVDNRTSAAVMADRILQAL